MAKRLGTALDPDTIGFTAEGLAAGDAVTSLVLASAGAAAGAPLAAAPYAILASDAEGPGLLGNYDIAYVAGELFVVPPAAGFEDTASSYVPIAQIPNPPDALALGGGPIREAAAARTDPLADAEETLAVLEGLAAELEAALEACRRSEPEVEAYLDCLGRELDRYAAALDAIALDLPEPLRGVSAVIQRASREVAAARRTAVRRLAAAETAEERERIGRAAIAEARAAIEVASEEVRAAITLIRAEEPRVASLQTEQGDAIAAALDTVDTELVRVVGL